MPAAESNASSGDSDIVVTKEIDAGLTKGARTLWQEELLLDYTIDVEDEQFRVHKVVMASVSDFFKAMFTGGMAESQTDRARLHALSPLAVSNMIQFAYTGQFGDNMASTEDMFACAVYFLMAPAMVACSELLVKELNHSNCFDRLSDFGSHNLGSCIAKTDEYIYNNLNDILDTINPNQMSFQGFSNLLYYWRLSDWDLFLRIKEWVNTDSENRRKHISDLMFHVRFGVMTPEELAAVKGMDIYLTAEGPWRDLVGSAEEYHNTPTHLKVMDYSGQGWVRENQYPLCFTADSERNVFYTLDEEDYWVENRALQTPDFRNGVAAVVEVNNFLIVCDQLSSYQQWYIFDPRTTTWSTMAGMSKPREAFALAHHGYHLYAFGGIEVLDNRSRVVTNSMEKYDFYSNTWSIISCSSPEPPPLQKSSACALDDKIYILGGWKTVNSDDQPYSDQLYCYDPLTNAWEAKEPIEKTHPSNKMLAMKNDGKSVILVVSDRFDLRVYRPTKDKWDYKKHSSGYTCYSHLKIVRNNQLSWHAAGMVLANTNVLYLLNFLQDDEEAEGEVIDFIRHPAKKSGGCVRWNLSNMWPEDDEDELGDFPIRPAETNGPERLHFSALLSIPLQSENAVDGTNK